MTVERLQSVLAQDYPIFHIIVVDNGSGDGSPSALSIVKQLTTERDNRYPYWCLNCLGRIVCEPNRGGEVFALTL